MELDAQLVGGPAQGHAARGGRARHGGAAEQHVGAQRLLRHRVGEGRRALAPVDALVGQRAVQGAPVAGGLGPRGRLGGRGERLR